MQAPSTSPRRARISFRVKLLATLGGLVSALGGSTLLMVRSETARQIELAIERATLASQTRFSELEKTWRHDLAGLSQRFSSSTRIPGAFEAADDEADPGVLHEAATYELKLAGVDRHLVAFLDTEGRPVTALLGRQAVSWQERLTLDLPLPGGPEETFGYQLVEGRLLAVHAAPLFIFSRHLGTILVGVPVEDEVARGLGEAIGAEVCFVAGQRQVATTAGALSSGLAGPMQAAAGTRQLSEVVVGGARWALAATPLSAAHPDAGARVVAIPLDPVLAPLERIRRSVAAVSGSVFLLAVAAAAVLSHGLSAPIQTLVAATDRVAEGDYDFQVHVETRDELATLGGAFNRMLHDLDLKERYRDLLDKVVSPEVAEEMLKGEVFLGGETRVVTTLFADVRGFTPLTEGMPPAEVIAMLNEYMDVAAAAVEAAGGVVDKYVGDEIMAVFGAPVAHDDDPLRAVTAAVRIQGAMATLNQDRQRRGRPPIALGIGISTGLAVAGNMGSHRRLNYTVLGETVNVAARLCAAAGAGSILVTGSTHDAVRQWVVAEELGPTALKGLSYPVQVFSIKELRAA